MWSSQGLSPSGTESKEGPSGSRLGSGSTRRTAFRKARKGLREAILGEDPETIIKDLRVLIRLCSRWGTSLKEALGPIEVLQELRDEALRGLDPEEYPHEFRATLLQE